jgi:hypothetical protein
MSEILSIEVAMERIYIRYYEKFGREFPFDRLEAFYNISLSSPRITVEKIICAELIEFDENLSEGNVSLTKKGIEYIRVLTLKRMITQQHGKYLCNDGWH